MTARIIDRIVLSTETTDGGGVRLRRSFGSHAALRLDPFLLFDEFGTDNPDDYIAGFPPHPHRGFETVTYMIDGHMRHEDHLGNVGELKSGGVQWMTAGRGIIHSEMPQQDRGRMRGFQLWINLPARDKMQPARYRDIPAGEIPEVALSSGGRLKLIAGRIVVDGREIVAPLNATPGSMATDPLYADVTLPADASLELPVSAGHNAFIYPFEGEVSIAGGRVTQHSAAMLSEGEVVSVTAGAAGARFVLVAGRPLGEPVVQYGPFVMNTREEIEQALADYRAGRLAA
ncbi:MAG: pirin family protein [Steroidobacteraceae bacterium]